MSELEEMREKAAKFVLAHGRTAQDMMKSGMPLIYLYWLGFLAASALVDVNRDMLKLMENEIDIRMAKEIHSTPGDVHQQRVDQMKELLSILDIEFKKNQGKNNG